MSDDDKEGMQEAEIEVVVAINEAKRRAWWKESRKELSGTLKGYSIRIAGFCKKESEKIKKCKILCPYAVGFDQAFYERVQ